VETDASRHPKKAAFLAAYRVSGNISTACIAAGIHRSTYYDWTEKDDAFTPAAQQALAEAGDLLEQHARDWATIGVPTVKEIYENGVLTRREVSRDLSPTLLIFLLKGAKPEKYRERLDVTQTQVTKTLDAAAWDSV
jgi:hypothetical protein